MNLPTELILLLALVQVRILSTCKHISVANGKIYVLHRKRTGPEQD